MLEDVMLRGKGDILGTMNDSMKTRLRMVRAVSYGRLLTMSLVRVNMSQKTEKRETMHQLTRLMA
jgi:hypothetical protein